MPRRAAPAREKKKGNWVSNFDDEGRAKALTKSRTRSSELKSKMIEALKSTLGVVTPAAEMIGLSRLSHYNWYNSDPKYKAQVDSIKDIALDFAESKLHQSIKNGSDIATIFFLKTQGKKRGYIERSEIELDGQMNITWGETRTYDSDIEIEILTDQKQLAAPDSQGQLED
jgi:hypothetical protein